MINDENKTEIIDLYLEGNLSEELQQEVEERMQTDALFRQEVALQKKVIKVIQDTEREKLKEEISSIFDEGNENKEAPVIPMQNRRLRYAIAASVSLLLVAATLFFILRPSTDVDVQYLAVNLPSGTRGELPDGVPEELPVLIYNDNQDYNFHYQLSDTLKLYGPFNVEELSLTYEPNRGNYLLTTSQETYLLVASENIQPLQP